MTDPQKNSKGISRKASIDAGLHLLATAGAVVSVSVAVNIWAFKTYMADNNGKFVNPINDDDQILANFDTDTDVDDGGFMFGLATAPAHVEDNLDDAWIDFANETMSRDLKPAPWYPPYGTPEEWSQNSGNLTGALHSEFLEQRVEVSNRAIQEAAMGNEIEEITDIPSQDFPELQRSHLDTNIDRPRLRYKTTDNPTVKIAQGLKGSRRYDPIQYIQTAGKVVKGSFRKKPVQILTETPNVASFHNVPQPERRLEFWTNPMTEIQLAKDAHQTVFRMGVDWGRLVPKEPINGTEREVNVSAVKRYREIMQSVRDSGMEIMMTLFHHSLPKWAAEYGGWKEQKTITYFLEFVHLVVSEFGDLIKFWITFNEPHIFAMLTYCVGAWPGDNPSLLQTATAALPMLGVLERVMSAIIEAHNEAYDVIHRLQADKEVKPWVGVAHHVSWMLPFGVFDAPAASLATAMSKFTFVDGVCLKCEFIGVNYYGQELFSGSGVKLSPNEEYSDSGRGVRPDGLFRGLLQFHHRYNVERKLGVKFIVTENGISDSTDYIRRPYLVEHLIAIYAAMKMGVPVSGYLHWTISDNWEWADGYGPKFGLVHVDRANNLKRTKRPSYHLYSEISRTGAVTKVQREKAWKDLQGVIKDGKTRPFYRQVEKNGLMFAGGLDAPEYRNFSPRDWRFGHYNYQRKIVPAPVSIIARFMLRVVSFGQLGKKKKPKQTPPESDTIIMVSTLKNLDIVSKESYPKLHRA